MSESTGRIGCVIMASGMSVRYGKNKLMEKLGGRELVLHAAGALIQAGLRPLAVTRSREIKELLDREGVFCILHDGALKSDTIRVGIENTDPDASGYLFMPGDQPLVQPDSLRRMIRQFEGCPVRAVRLGFGDTVGSPVIIPAFCRESLLAYKGDRGGMEVLKGEQVPYDVVQASHEWELWDVDTPADFERVSQRGRFC